MSGFIGGMPPSVGSFSVWVDMSADFFTFTSSVDLSVGISGIVDKH